MIAVALDVILLFVVIEGAGLVLLHARTGQGIAPHALLPNLTAGFLLMAAVRIALLAGTPSATIEAALAAILLLALLAHVADLAARWPRATGQH